VQGSTVASDRRRAFLLEDFRRAAQAMASFSCHRIRVGRNFSDLTQQAVGVFFFVEVFLRAPHRAGAIRFTLALKMPVALVPTAPSSAIRCWCLDQAYTPVMLNEPGPAPRPVSGGGHFDASPIIDSPAGCVL
jgi:hypothetical protein